MCDLEKIFKVLYKSDITLLRYTNESNKDLFLSKLNLMDISDYDLSTKNIYQISREFVIGSILSDDPYFLYIDLNLVKKISKVFDLIIHINEYNDKSLKLIITSDSNVNTFRGGRRIQYVSDFILNILGSYIIVDKSSVYHFKDKTELVNLENFNLQL